MNIPKPLERAIQVAGSQAALGRLIGVSSQRVWWWLNKCDGRVTPELCQAIERTTGITRHELRPDVFGRPSEAA
ncbi:YdaS family helix-turn-helix protein [Thiocystis violacea]|uniref:transcriptional regulator n=1 Tax=Thiocystis violacea TaxID=13725 RepID=UPI0019060EBD|nr:hypothetical protein [Thiocystis violacea]